MTFPCLAQADGRCRRRVSPGRQIGGRIRFFAAAVPDSAGNANRGFFADEISRALVSIRRNGGKPSIFSSASTVATLPPVRRR
jgi:hypothetical protein